MIHLLMRVHLRTVPNKTKAIEPIIHTIYLPSFVLALTHFFNARGVPSVLNLVMP
jgi:hypothetical protein